MLKIALKTLIILVFLTSCEALKPKKVDKSVPVNAQDRARKAVDEGRGISLEGLVGGRKGTNYEFSNFAPAGRRSPCNATPGEGLSQHCGRSNGVSGGFSTR